MNATSRFSLGDNLETPTHFMSDMSVKTTNTDEYGNRCSILPSAKRPKVPSVKKKKTQKSEVAAVEDDGKNMLEKLQEEVKVLKGSKGIKKNTERQNFVRLNMNKNYKPRSRGAVYSNKIMAKKKNQLKFRENFKRKM